MRELPFLISDVRDATDNRDVNGVKDKEFIRYFQDAVKSIQAIIFKNNPLCSYFQYSVDVLKPINGVQNPLPLDTYADNAVTFVEDETGLQIERCWPEDVAPSGWYTRNRSIVFLGCGELPKATIVYFKRLPRWDKVWATVSGKNAQMISLTVLDADFFGVDNHITVLDSEGAVKLAGLKFTKLSDTEITVVGDITSVIAGDQIVMGKNTTLNIDLPEEVEPYLLDYVAKRIYGRNNYGADASKIEYFTAEARDNIVQIFGDVGQSQVRTPITDTDYLGV